MMNWKGTWKEFSDEPGLHRTALRTEIIPYQAGHAAHSAGTGQ
jgi:hypothetical protein